MKRSNSVRSLKDIILEDHSVDLDRLPKSRAESLDMVRMQSPPINTGEDFTPDAVPYTPERRWRRRVSPSFSPAVDLPRPPTPWRARIPAGAVPTLADITIAQHPGVVDELRSSGVADEVVMPHERRLREQEDIVRERDEEIREKEFHLQSIRCRPLRYSNTVVFHNQEPDVYAYSPTEVLKLLEGYASAVYFCSGPSEEREMVASTDGDYDVNGYFESDEGTVYEVWINGLDAGPYDMRSVFCACSPRDRLTVALYTTSTESADEYWSDPFTFTGALTYGGLFAAAGEDFLQKVLDHYADGDDEVQPSNDLDEEWTEGVTVKVDMVLNGRHGWYDLRCNA